VQQCTAPSCTASRCWVSRLLLHDALLRYAVCITMYRIMPVLRLYCTALCCTALHWYCKHRHPEAHLDSFHWERPCCSLSA